MRLVDADMLFENVGKIKPRNKEHYKNIGEFMSLITNAPTINVKWIPCSERLPEYRKLVLVTTRDLRVKPAYLDSIQDNGTDDWWNIPLDDADCASWNILAWMPLPEPWEGVEK